MHNKTNTTRQGSNFTSRTTRGRTSPGASSSSNNRTTYSGKTSNFGSRPSKNFGLSPRSFNKFSNTSSNNSGSSYRGGSSSRNGSGSRGGSSNRYSSFGRSGRGARKAIDVSKFINKVEIVEKAEVFTPEHKFNDFNIHESLKKNISDRGFVNPTPIQDRIIPYIIQGKDVVGMANTGTGKTAAFLIPLINKVILNRFEKIMIIVPTRELAQQIQDELISFSREMKIFSVVCVGGVSINFQINNLRRSYNFLIGTPGRIKDLVQRKQISVNSFKTVVLDEADRMLDMGFVNDMKFIINQMPSDKHGMFFSATLSREIEAIIKDFLKEPLTISVKTQEIAKNIEQDIIRVSKDQKMNELVKLLKQEEFKKVLIFSQTKRGVEKVTKELQDKGFKVDSIHGNKTQSNRQRTLNTFKKHLIQILVATDVAARGLDIDDISHVINFDTPESHEDYVHRIGRTGRGDKLGKALTFVDRF